MTNVTLLARVSYKIVVEEVRVCACMHRLCETTLSLRV